MSRVTELSPSAQNRFSALASELASHVDEIADRAIAQIRSEAPQFAVDVPELAEAVSSGSRPSILAELVAMQEGGRVPEQCPAVDAEGARLAARFGVPLQMAIWVYRVGHRAQWGAWYRLVERAVPDRSLRTVLHEAGSEFFFEYADRISAWVTEEYTDERDRLLRGREQRRISVVRELLAGSSPDPGPLDYELEASHIGVVASGDAGAEAIGQIAAMLKREALTLHVEDALCWGWLGSPADPGGAGEELVTREIELPEDVAVSIGCELNGVVGFRRTHEQALAVHRLIDRSSGITHYRAVELEVMAGADPELAAEFAERELGELAGSGGRAEILRETLRAYFASGHNGASTAAALGVHEQTIANRLARIERQTGMPVAARHAELELALRLVALSRP